ncbi:DUF3299 domain-containing protein [Ruegeria profundi]|uniref:DUF3299 domain-containing protein n=1 Tax=Ruegeria profundi TaxID=1685378 RepID=UPI001CD471C6|nr:DUF3299 domain-containing protein [Ruegeria profundi]MCA0929513.1 DUF3299 domain-containing protein [Ruegeria profundi]
MTIAFLAWLGLLGPAFAAPGALIDWTVLPDPAAQSFDDPFRALTPEQRDDILFAIRLRGRLQTDVGSPDERQRWYMLLAETEQALATDQIDIDGLLSQREVVSRHRKKADTAGNPKLDGQIVTVTGYALPAPPDKDGQRTAYLVPQPGMCSHLPPPPPNQMIRVKLHNGWTPAYDHEPVRLTGRLVIDPSDHVVNVVDGLVQMRATFRMDAELVEPLADEPGQAAWPPGLKDRLRAARSRKTGGSQAQD